MIDRARILLLCSIVAVLCLLATILFAQENEKGKGLHVGRIAICTDVQNRAPLGVDTTFSAAEGSLYCFTRIEGATDTTSVTHVWYYGEKKMAEVTLPVQSIHWRTWSNKQILPQWTGKWTVVILSEDSDPLAQTSFLIQSRKTERISQVQDTEGK